MEKDINGIINVLKPCGMTSFDVIKYLRGLLKIKKIGHTGTLDPKACGVLPVCIGKATKAIQYICDVDKLYRAEMILGIETDTQDSDGKVLKRIEKEYENDEIVFAMNSFVGDYEQIPPMYSAVKIKGKKLYEYARKGIEIERKPKKVQIKNINIINISKTEIGAGIYQKVLFDVECSKGTYIRTLCSDIGNLLGCGGHLSFLVRVRSGEFDLNDAIPLENVEKLSADNAIYKKIIKVDTVLSHFKSIKLEENDLYRFNCGQLLQFNDKSFDNNEILRVYDFRNKFHALGVIIMKNGRAFLKPEKFFEV